MPIRRWLLPLAVFILVLVLHALYVSYTARLPVHGWAADTAIVDNGFWGFRPYLEAQDYFIGYSYALPVAFASVALRPVLGVSPTTHAHGEKRGDWRRHLVRISRWFGVLPAGLLRIAYAGDIFEFAWTVFPATGKTACSWNHDSDGCVVRLLVDMAFRPQ